MRRWNWKANHGNEQPSRIVCYDTETWQDEAPRDNGRVVHSFRLGCARLLTRKGEVWRERATERFNQRHLMMEWIVSQARKKETLWVYAHNASFDAAVLGLWEALDSGLLSTSLTGRRYVDPRTKETRTAKDRHGILAVDSLPFIAETWGQMGMVKWVDTLNYIPVPLAQLAEWVGLEKWGLPSESASDDDWHRYCQNDVNILTAAVIKLMGLWKGRRLGNWQATIAGLAFSCFRHLAPNNGITAHGDEPATADDIAPFWIARQPIPLDAYDVSRMERRAYYGGETLVSYVGDIGPMRCFPGRVSLYESRTDRPRIDGPVTVFDVNGLYAHVMAEGVYPVELLDAFENPEIDQLFNLVRQFPCVADVSLNSPDYAYPYRPDKRTMYVRGRMNTTLCGPDLIRAMEGGHVIRCSAVAVYHAGRPFREFVKYWWGLREEALKNGDACTAKLSKGMYTGLFGKLGQRKPMWKRVHDVTTDQRWGPFIYDRGDGRKFQRFRAVAGAVQELAERRDCGHTFTAAAAYVTSYGRYFMERLRSQLPWHSVCYQDTDSLFCLPPAVDNLVNAGLVHDTELGKLKNQGTYETVSIYGAKNYDKNSVPVVAGLRSRRQELGHRRWVQWHFERCNSIIGRTPDGTLHSWQQVFSAPGQAAGYSVHGNGWTVPVRLG